MDDSVSLITHLERLEGLRDRGVLTAEEFSTQKAALLSARGAAEQVKPADPQSRINAITAQVAEWQAHGAPALEKPGMNRLVGEFMSLRSGLSRSEQAAVLTDYYRAVWGTEPPKMGTPGAAYPEFGESPADWISPHEERTNEEIRKNFRDPFKHLRAFAGSCAFLMPASVLIWLFSNRSLEQAAGIFAVGLIGLIVYLDCPSPRPPPRPNEKTRCPNCKLLDAWRKVASRELDRWVSSEEVEVETQTTIAASSAYAQPTSPTPYLTGYRIDKPRQTVVTRSHDFETVTKVKCEATYACRHCGISETREEVEILD